MDAQNTLTKERAEQILGLRNPYTRNEMRQAARRLISEWRPDVAAHHGHTNPREVQGMFQAIQQSANLLGNQFAGKPDGHRVVPGPVMTRESLGRAEASWQGYQQPSPQPQGCGYQEGEESQKPQPSVPVSYQLNDTAIRKVQRVLNIALVALLIVAFYDCGINAPWGNYLRDGVQFLVLLPFSVLVVLSEHPLETLFVGALILGAPSWVRGLLNTELESPVAGCVIGMAGIVFSFLYLVPFGPHLGFGTVHLVIGLLLILYFAMKGVQPSRET